MLSLLINSDHIFPVYYRQNKYLLGIISLLHIHIITAILLFILW